MIFKNNKSKKQSSILLIIAFVLAPLASYGQASPSSSERVKEMVKEKDSQFWKAYNKCDVNSMVSYLTSDLEFYHDKSGLTKGLETFKKSIETGLCANGPQLKRVVKEGSVEIFPLNGVGAIIRGEHYFYIGDRADGLAKFTHVWTNKNGEWKMSRVLSYDHQPVPIKIPDAISLSAALLKTYIGDYSGNQTGNVSIKLDGEQLKLVGSEFELKLFAKDENTFFTKEQPVLFEFVKNDAGMISKMLVKENGNIAEELNKTK